MSNSAFAPVRYPEVGSAGAAVAAARIRASAVRELESIDLTPDTE